MQFLDNESETSDCNFDVRTERLSRGIGGSFSYLEGNERKDPFWYFILKFLRKPEESTFVFEIDTPGHAIDERML